MLYLVMRCMYIDALPHDGMYVRTVMSYLVMGCIESATSLRDRYSDAAVGGVRHS